MKRMTYYCGIFDDKATSYNVYIYHSEFGKWKKKLIGEANMVKY